jgi:hypothetical protein
MSQASTLIQIVDEVYTPQTCTKTKSPAMRPIDNTLLVSPRLSTERPEIPIPIPIEQGSYNTMFCVCGRLAPYIPMRRNDPVTVDPGASAESPQHKDYAPQQDHCGQISIRNCASETRAHAPRIVQVIITLRDTIARITRLGGPDLQQPGLPVMRRLPRIYRFPRPCLWFVA